MREENPTEGVLPEREPGPSYQGEDVQWLTRHRQTVTLAVSVGHVGNSLDLEGPWRERASSGFRGRDKQGCREQNAV